MPTSLPRVVFLSRKGRLGNEDALLLAIRAHGYSLSVIRSVGEIVPAIDAEPGRVIVIADQMSTLYEPTSIKGFDDFLHIYGTARMTRNVNLLVIFPGCNEIEKPDTMKSYGNLLTCIMFTPVDPQELVQFLDRASDNEKYWLPLRRE
ncbi:hypothetical protein [uncultured Desulfobulbus sp.]|uniref:hypothetical protein n=1 Tax=uncultured Desulfobulbus sp. TaxID=239745 RepID=UPI0029C928D4|nr:hypothetical protein [uncultured Desulfobulbus sp.]